LSFEFEGGEGKMDEGRGALADGGGVKVILVREQ